MDRLKLNIDLKGLGDRIATRLNVLANAETLLRPVALGLVAQMTERIHDKGNDANDTPIGNYTSGYLKTRQAKFNRTADPKVIVSLTRQLENDWSVIATNKGYGIGFKNSFNRDKAGWVEGTYEKPIFKLSKSEREYAQKRFTELINEQFDI